MAVDVQQNAAAPAVDFGHRRGLGVAQFDQREFGGDEAVECHQEQRGEEVKQVLQAWLAMTAGIGSLAAGFRLPRAALEWQKLK